LITVEWESLGYRRGGKIFAGRRKEEANGMRRREVHLEVEEEEGRFPLGG
jgi:hypothetical protein